MKVAIKKTVIKYHTFQEDPNDKNLARRTDSEMVFYGGRVTDAGCSRKVAKIAGAIYDGFTTVTETYEIPEEFVVENGSKLEKVDSSKE